MQCRCWCWHPRHLTKIIHANPLSNGLWEFGASYDPTTAAHSIGEPRFVPGCLPLRHHQQMALPSCEEVFPNKPVLHIRESSHTEINWGCGDYQTPPFCKRKIQVETEFEEADFVFLYRFRIGRHHAITNVDLVGGAFCLFQGNWNTFLFSKPFSAEPSLVPWHWLLHSLISRAKQKR